MCLDTAVLGWYLCLITGERKCFDTCVRRYHMYAAVEESILFLERPVCVSMGSAISHIFIPDHCCMMLGGDMSSIEVSYA